ncbi:hypothetical protein I4U23_017258 [Adineta vaga]|nr:hypothetical protein I4U23_017258 [Adineta vaga]
MSSVIDVQTISTITRWLNYVLAIPMIIFGMIGSILTVLVFARRRTLWNYPTITYLLAGSIITAIHLPTIYLLVVLADGFGIVLFNYNDIICRLFNYFLYVTTVSAIYFPCLAAFDQYVCTCPNAAFRNRWHNMKVVRLAICGTILFWSILFLPILIIYQLVNNSCSITNYSPRVLKNYVVTPLFFTIIPIILIIFFLRSMIRNIRLLKLNNYQQDRFERQIRRMLFVQLIILAVSGFPFALESAYLEATSTIQETRLRKAVENLVLQVLRFFFHVNLVGTFYLYISSEVRKTVRQLFMRFRD